MSDDVIGRNHVTVRGKGTQPMLFAHGFGCDQNMWRFVAPAFEQDYRLVLFDYVGMGKSDIGEYSPARYSGLQGYVDDVLDIIRTLELQQVIFVGHSVSAMIGILAAIQQPDRFHRLILIGPSPYYMNDPPQYHGGFERADIEGLLSLMERNYIGWAKTLAGTVMKNPDRPELTQELEESFCSTDPVIAKRFAEVTFLSDNRKDLPQLKIPSLILQCSEDAIAPQEVGRYVHHHLPGSTLRVMSASGHCPHMSHPEETITLMREYLSAL